MGIGGGVDNDAVIYAVGRLNSVYNSALMVGLEEVHADSLGVAGGADEREQGFVILTAVNGRLPQPQKVQVRAVDDQKFHDSASLMVFRVSSSAPSLETVMSANCAYSGFRRA